MVLLVRVLLQFLFVYLSQDMPAQSEHQAHFCLSHNNIHWHVMYTVRQAPLTKKQKTTLRVAYLDRPPLAYDMIVAGSVRYDRCWLVEVNCVVEVEV